MAINPADITTIRVGQLVAEPPTLSSIIPHELSDELKSCTVSQLIDLLNLNVGSFQYEVKTLYVDQEYIDNNLDSTGLGINLLDGWAEINGNNGTPPASGLFELSRKAGVYDIGAFGGYKDATLVDHFHTVGVNTNAAGSGFPAFEASSVAGTFQTSSVGEDGTNKNMPPYYVCLKIMKL